MSASLILVINPRLKGNYIWILLVYHLFALTYTEDGEEKNVYASARFSGAPSLQSMLAYADRFYGEAPALETQDALKYGKADIDLDKVLSEAK